MIRYPGVALAVLASSILMFGSGCGGYITGMYPGGPSPAGLLFTNVDVPAQSLTVATDNTAASVKTGTSSARALLGLIAFGDASIQAAMQDGGITKVHHVDHQVVHILAGGLYLSTTTIVHGE